MKLTKNVQSGVAALVLAAATLANAQNATTCADGVHMIIARGSEEDPGPGRMGIVAEGIEKAISGSNIESVDYPATFASYGTSVDEGVQAMSDALTRYTERCPDGKVVLMGYSQGAQVTLNTLCGGEDEGHIFQFEDNPPFDQATVNRSVIAVIVYGDPSHTTDAPWNEGNSTKDGLFARQNITACLPYAPIIRSWCDTGDRYCDLGNVSAVHGSYFRTYFDDTVEFVVDRFDEATNDTSPTSSGSPSGTESPSPTGSDGAEESGDGDSAAGVVVVSWGVMAVAGLVAFMNL